MKKKQKQKMEMVKKDILMLLKEEPATVEKENYKEIEDTILQMKQDRNHQKDLYEKEAKRKNDLITYLAHDLKTPLASVIGYLSFLEDAKDISNKQKQKFTKIALDKAYRLEDLIEQFFEITRFNLQTILLNKEPIKLSLLLEQLADEFYPIVAKQNKKIQLKIKEDISMKVDPDKFGRVLNNIMRNAISYSYENTTILIETFLEEKILSIKIHNKGNEIPKHKLNKIFEKFYRLDNSRNTAKGGSGLGLAIAKDIIEAHQGTIKAESSNEETVFTITVPIIS